MTFLSGVPLVNLCEHLYEDIKDTCQSDLEGRGPLDRLSRLNMHSLGQWRRPGVTEGVTETE